MYSTQEIIESCKSFERHNYIEIVCYLGITVWARFDKSNGMYIDSCLNPASKNGAHVIRAMRTFIERSATV